MTPEQRSLALMHALGWQGGTIHQVAAVTGCEVADLLHGEDDAHLGGAFGMGFSAVRTCGREFFNRTAEKHFGVLAFWLGVAEGQHLNDGVSGCASFEASAACHDWKGRKS